jgi:hypothetical protein
VTQLSSYDRLSVVKQTRTQRVQAAQMAQSLAWSQELKQGLADYEAQQQALAAAQAQAAVIASRSNHPPPLPRSRRTSPTRSARSARPPSSGR